MLRTDRSLIAGIAAVAALLAGVVPSATAQAVNGEAFAARVQTRTVPQTTAARAVLGSAEMAEASTDALAVPGALTSDLATAVTTGAAGPRRSAAQSVATASDVSILNGLVRAARVIAVAASTGDGAAAASTANGSTFEQLVVNGVAVATDGAVAPNTRLTLPGVGYVVLNEQLRSGSGSASRITVNMIHVVLTDPLTGARTGEIIVASATSGVS